MPHHPKGRGSSRDSAKLPPRVVRTAPTPVYDDPREGLGLETLESPETWPEIAGLRTIDLFDVIERGFTWGTRMNKARAIAALAELRNRDRAAMRSLVEG